METWVSCQAGLGEGALIPAWFFDITMEVIVRTHEIACFELFNSSGEVVKAFDDEILVGRCGRAEVDGDIVKIGFVIDDPMISPIQSRITR